jgi:hypothetical protein
VSCRQLLRFISLEEEKMNPYIAVCRNKNREKQKAKENVTIVVL